MSAKQVFIRSIVFILCITQNVDKIRTFKLYIVYKFLKMFYILDFFINLCLICQRWSCMLKTIQQDKFQDLSTMINYGNMKKYKQRNWVL